MKFSKFTVASLGIATLAAAGCAPGPSNTPPDTAAQRLLCPELAGNVDPLEASFADKPSTDAQLRALVSAVRGVNDVTLEIEKRAVETCARIRHDIGAPEVPANAPLDKQCEPIRNMVAKLAAEGVTLRISIAPPRCNPDASRKSKCTATAAGAPDAAALCEAESVIYSRCTLPAISFASSRGGDDIFKLGQSLEANLPSLIYAEYALGRRLSDHIETIAKIAPKLATELKEAGPHGVACVGLSATTAARSAERVKSFLAMSAQMLAGLTPELANPKEGLQ